MKFVSSSARFALALLLSSGPAFAQPCDPADPALVKPDLKAAEPLRARVVQRNGARRLYFTTKIENRGPGPLIVEGKTVSTPFGPVTEATQILWRQDGSTCRRPAGTFEFHASHNHFHLNDFAEYQLRRGNPLTGEVVARASKVSFCLLDIEPIRGMGGRRQVFGQCGTQEGIQGLSSGWADVYDDFYPEQLIELDSCRTDGGVPPGQYWLVNVADPDDVLLEDREDYASNAGWVSVNIPARVGNAPVPSGPNCGSTDPTPVPTAPRPPGGPTAIPPTAVPTVRVTPSPTPRIVARPTRAPRPPRPTRVPRPARVITR